MNERKAVIAIVTRNGKILIGKKISDSDKFMSGKWHLLGENVEVGETDEQALLRGVFEETGIKIKVGKFFGSYPTPTGKLANFYECVALTKKLIVGSDLEDAKWIKKDQVKKLLKERQHLWPKKVKDYFN